MNLLNIVLGFLWVSWFWVLSTVKYP